MKCSYAPCARNNALFIIDEARAVVPPECNLGDLRGLFSYFQYRAPNIEATQSPTLDVTKHEAALHALLKGRAEFAFCAQNADMEKELSKYALQGTEVCSRCKRFLCKKTNRKSRRDLERNESELECLLRHLRNSIAHGRVYVVPKKNFISVLFEDIGEKNRISARIVCCQADLKRWRKTLIEYTKS